MYALLYSIYNHMHIYIKKDFDRNMTKMLLLLKQLGACAFFKYLQKWCSAVYYWGVQLVHRTLPWSHMRNRMTEKLTRSHAFIYLKVSCNISIMYVGNVWDKLGLVQC